MNVYCLSEFKSQYEKLKKNNSYRDLEGEIISTFFNKNPVDFFLNGAKITGPHDMPFIKKRIKGRGGWRFYYLLFVKDGNLYLMFLHPKRGSEGAENVNDDFEKLIYKDVLNCIKSNDLFTVTVSEKSLVFEHNLLTSKDEL